MLEVEGKLILIWMLGCISCVTLGHVFTLTVPQSCFFFITQFVLKALGELVHVKHLLPFITEYPKELCKLGTFLLCFLGKNMKLRKV